MVLRPSSCPRFLSAPRRRVYPHVGFSCAMRTMSSRMSFATGGRPGLRFAITSSPSTCPHSSKPLFEVSTVEARSCRALINWKNNTAPSWLTGR